jgi:hypothetical protein
VLAGAVLGRLHDVPCTIARSSLPDFGLRIHTNSKLHGLTRNPWHPNVTAGGSSGDGGSALSSGISPIGLGNDIGGSLRHPAHCCGIDLRCKVLVADDREQRKLLSLVTGESGQKTLANLLDTPTCSERQQRSPLLASSAVYPWASR